MRLSVPETRHHRAAIAEYIDARAAALTGWLAVPGRFYACLAAYMALLWFIRSFVFASGSVDDLEQLRSAQTFELGYQFRNPPMITWLYAVVLRATGPSLAVVLAVKFAILFLFYLVLHRGALAVLRDRRLALLATLLPFSIYGVSWVLTLTYSHSVLLVLVCAATFWVLVNLEREGTLAWYAAFGLVLGCGLVTKHNYAVFAAGLIGAGLLDPGLRRRFFDLRALLSVAIALAIALPSYLWLLDHAEQLEGVLAHRFQLEAKGSILFKPLQSAWQIASALFGFAGPPLILMIMAFRESGWRWLRGAEIGRGGEPARYARFLVAAMAIMLAVGLIAMWASGAVKVQDRYFLIFILLPIWAMGRLGAVGYAARGAARLCLALVALAALVPTGLIGHFFVDPLTRDFPEHNVPMASISEAIRASGFKHGTVYSYNYPYQMAGALRPYFPGSRFVSVRDLHLIPPERKEQGQCLVVVLYDKTMNRSSARAELDTVGQLFDFTPPETPRIEQLSLPYVAGHGRMVNVEFALLAKDAGTCH